MVLLKVPLYLAAHYLVDYSATHAALHLFLWELKHLSQCLRPLRGPPGRWKPQMPSFTVWWALQHLSTCWAPWLVSSSLLSWLWAAHREVVQWRAKGFSSVCCLLSGCDLFFTYLWLRKSLSPKRELKELIAPSLHWMLFILIYRQ